MLKYIILIMASLCLASCTAHNERYYRLNPKVLQLAIADCPDKKPADISCEQLKNIAAQVNELAYQLRLNPQGYGNDVLKLQETIAKQELSLSKASNQHEPQSSLMENKQQLEERLAVVKWLESPGG